MCTHQLSSGRRPPALGGTTVGQLGVQGPPLRAEPGGEGLSRLHPRSPAPWSHLHACHPMDDTLALGDGPGRKGRDSGTCAQNMGPRAWSASAHGSGSPPTSRGSAPRGADAGRSRARARPGPVCRRLSTDGVGHSTGGVSGPGSPRLPCNLGSPTGMLLAVLLYHGRLPRLFQRNLLYSQKSKYRVPRGRPVQGPGGSQMPEEGSRGWGPR